MGLPQWVLWKYGSRDGKPTKLPINANTGRLADTTNSATWTTFENATASQNGNGLGYVFSADDRFTGIDFDACRDPESKVIFQWAKDWIIKLNSYSEVSPSGTGIKVWVKAQLPMDTGKKKFVAEPELIPGKKPSVEAYDHARYFAVTGDRLDDLPAEPQERQEVIDELCRAFFSKPAQSSYREEVKASRSSVVERARKYLDTIPGAISGYGGHNQTFYAACVLILGFGLTKPEALALLLEYNRRCEPPWSDRELQHKVDSADKQEGQRGYLRDKRRSEWASTSVPDYREGITDLAPANLTLVDQWLKTADPDGIHLTDIGNAKIFAMQYGADVRFCKQIGWFVWDGHRWLRDDTGAISALAKQTVLECYSSLAGVADQDFREKVFKHLVRSESAKGITSMLTLAESEEDISIGVGQLDQDHYLFNVLNGTLNLRTGELQEHRRGDHITRLAPVLLSPNFLPFWKEFFTAETQSTQRLKTQKPLISRMGSSGHGLLLSRRDGAARRSSELESRKQAPPMRSDQRSHPSTGVCFRDSSPDDSKSPCPRRQSYFLCDLCISAVCFLLGCGR